MNVNYVIVLSVLEGKNFPIRHDKYLLAEAKFDGEVMSTDPSNHILRPHFSTELAWELDKKELQKHRLQRTPIKLQWYAVDVDLTKKETIGYMILDIRLAQEKLQSPQWYPLLNTKYQKEKPQVLISMYLEKQVEDASTMAMNGINSLRRSNTKSLIPRSLSKNDDRPEQDFNMEKTASVKRQNSTHNNGSEPHSSSGNRSSDNSPPEVRDRSIISSPPNSLPIKNDSATHRYQFCLDLCSFKATRLAHPIIMFIRYSYPFFGTTSSMITHPDVEVNPKRDISIPHGYGTFNFATTYVLLKSTFWETPLILDVLHRKKGGQEQTVGTARINLFQVLDATCVSHSVDKKKGMKQMSTCKVVVTSPEGYEIGEIYVSLTLIDFGPTFAVCDHYTPKSTSSGFNEGCSYTPNFNVPLLRQNGLTQDEMLQAAVELQLWQEQQRELFRAQLKDKEMQHLAVLTSDWRQRDMERELVLQKQLQECHKLESKLKTTLKEAEIKENRLTSQEAELSERLRKFDEQQEQQNRDAKRQIDSLKIEFNETLSRERLNVRSLEEKNSSLMLQVKELERELQEQRSIAENLRSQIKKDPDVQLRTEVNILNMEKAELQQKLEIALSSKQKYKCMYTNLYRQERQLQQKLHLLEYLERERKEKLTAFQQKRMSVEERSIAQTNEDILERMSDQVESLKSMVSPEGIQQHVRHMPLNVRTRSADSTPTTNSSQLCLNSNLLPKTTKPLSNGLPPTTMCPTTNGNAPVVQNGTVPTQETTTQEKNSSNNSTPLPEKTSGIPKPIKHSPDLNGNTTAKDTNPGIKHLLAKKESLLVGGYTEQDRLIKDLNVYIEKAKNGFK